MLVGDAFGFLDPLYSSGVLLALKSGELAADAVCDGLAKGDVSARQLGHWGPMINQGIDRMLRLVCEYYDGFSFGKFVHTFPHLRGTVTDLPIGDLFSDRVDKCGYQRNRCTNRARRRLLPWNAAAPPEVVENKANELVLPAGPKP